MALPRDDILTAFDSINVRSRGDERAAHKPQRVTAPRHSHGLYSAGVAGAARDLGRQDRLKLHRIQMPPTAFRCMILHGGGRSTFRTRHT